MKLLVVLCLKAEEIRRVYEAAASLGIRANRGWFDVCPQRAGLGNVV